MKLKIHKSAFEAMLQTIGALPCETGGMLFGDREMKTVKEFHFDKNGSSSSATRASYSPDIVYCNRVIKEKKDQGMEFMGMAHSHPPGFNRLSGSYGDLGYAKDIFEAMSSLDYLVCPILFSSADCYKPEFIPYVIERDQVEDYQKAELEILDDQFQFDSSKIEGAVDYDLMQCSKVVVVGLGGASGLCIDLVRTGIENLVICDFDTVDTSNLTTQGFTLEDVGKRKSEVLSSELRKINPNINLEIISRDFTTLDEAELSDVLNDTSLLLMMTDSFKCQAFGNRIALNFGIPTVWAGMHERAQGCEVIFTIPESTQSCFRCITNPRYDYYSAGNESNLTSSRSTIFDTHYLNDLIGKTALAVLHRDTEGFEYSNWLTTDILSRNLIHTKLHPAYSSNRGNLFRKLFGRKKEFYTFASAWRKMDRKKHVCPDCGSTKKLSDSIGKFKFDELVEF